MRRLADDCPRLEVIKRSVCIEGARRALARAKVHWGKLDAEKLVKDGPPPGKEHRKPEMYYEGVLKGARLVADECSMNVIFGELAHFVLCTENLFMCAKQCFLNLKYYLLCGHLSNLRDGESSTSAPMPRVLGCSGINLGALFPIFGSFEGGAQPNE